MPILRSTVVALPDSRGRSAMRSQTRRKATRVARVFFSLAVILRFGLGLGLGLVIDLPHISR